MKTAKDISDMFLTEELAIAKKKSDEYIAQQEYLKSKEYEDKCLEKAEKIAEDGVNKLIEECSRRLKSCGSTNGSYIYVHIYHSEKVAKLSKDILRELGYRTDDITHYHSREYDECPDSPEYWTFKLEK